MTSQSAPSQKEQQTDRLAGHFAAQATPGGGLVPSQSHLDAAHDQEPYAQAQGHTHEMQHYQHYQHHYPHQQLQVPPSLTFAPEQPQVAPSLTYSSHEHPLNDYQHAPSLLPSLQAFHDAHPGELNHLQPSLPLLQSHHPQGGSARVPGPFGSGTTHPADGKRRLPSYTPILSLPPKNKRSSKACDPCRKMKRKCDEGQPCAACRDRQLECIYRDIILETAVKPQAQILDEIQSIQASLRAILDRSVSMNKTLETIESSIFQHPRGTETQPEFTETTQSVTPIETTGVGRNETGDINGTPLNAPLRLGGDEFATQPGPMTPGEPAIPMHHTTLASLLLEWPGIYDLVKGHVRYPREYPIRLEQNRDPLFAHESGKYDQLSRKSLHLSSHSSLGSSYQDSAAPSFATHHTHPDLVKPWDAKRHQGGRGTPSHCLDFSESNVWMYVESFKANILIMHPIIEPNTLNGWVAQFLRSLSVMNIPFAKPTFAVQDQGFEALERFPTVADGFDGVPTMVPASTKMPDRSILSALILTVLALGKFCLHREKTPGITRPSDTVHPAYIDQAAVLTGILTPEEPCYNLPKGELSMHGLYDAYTGGQMAENDEAVPGVEYFAYATDILGNYAGAYHSMQDVYANILAGLYHGQLARPLESFAFIQRASHKLQVMIRTVMPRMHKLKTAGKLIEDVKENQMVLTFWTCLQLECDILTELQLPPSDLLSYHDAMPLPNMSLLKGFDTRILDSYLGQLYLRNHLNGIHHLFYGPGRARRSATVKLAHAHLVDEGVCRMDWVPPSFYFHEDDDPASNILDARMRAKYWGAQVITYRPFIKQILTFSQARSDNTAGHDIHDAAGTTGDVDFQVLALAQRGIKALVESTRAFHGLGEKRPVITNVFGTAHAQWGNLLVLSAAFQNPILRPFVDEELLHFLFEKTIQFLRHSATVSSSLWQDLEILERIRGGLNLILE